MPTTKPATIDESTIERKVPMRSELVAGERVRMAYVVRCVVDNIDVGEAHESHDKETKHHRHQRLSKSSDLAGSGRRLCNLGLDHCCSPRSICCNSINSRATSRLVRWRFVLAGMHLRVILTLAAALDAASNSSKEARQARGVGSTPSNVRNVPRCTAQIASIIPDRKNQSFDIGAPASFL